MIVLISIWESSFNPEFEPQIGYSKNALNKMERLTYVLYLDSSSSNFLKEFITFLYTIYVLNLHTKIYNSSLPDTDLEISIMQNVVPTNVILKLSVYYHKNAVY